jgi:ATP-dependent helicase/nuclease subunit A
VNAPSAAIADATRRQRRAAAPDATAWVGASAGTGKTKVLADRVLSLLLDGAAPERLLCLTYTRAAAAEMANRINLRLARWSVAEDDELRESLAELCGAEPDVARPALARRLFARVLDTPGGLKIMTLHAFCQSLIARFPLEADIAPHFEVMDERTAAEALRDARAAVLAAPDASLARAVEVVSGWVNEDQFAEVLKQLARDRGRFARLLEAASATSSASGRKIRRPR